MPAPIMQHGQETSESTSRATAGNGEISRRWRRLVAWLGLAGLAVAGTVHAADSVVKQRHALESRVLAVRAAMQAERKSDVSTETDSNPRGVFDESDPVAQWFNWPNWGNWNNWPNWGNWGNWFNR